MDWQNQREGTGENIADFVSTGIGYVIPGAGAAQVAGNWEWERRLAKTCRNLAK